MAFNSNVPNNANTFLPPSPVAPMFLLISAITQANPMVVTVSTPNAFVSGQLCYFSIPFDYGMFQLNAMTAQITAIDTTNTIFTMALDSSQFDPFVIPAMYSEQPASLSSAGSRNLYNTTTVPFHSIGNVGN